MLRVLAAGVSLVPKFVATRPASQIHCRFGTSLSIRNAVDCADRMSLRREIFPDAQRHLR
jgi:hypothetical protein